MTLRYEGDIDAVGRGRRGRAAAGRVPEARVGESEALSRALGVAASARRDGGPAGLGAGVRRRGPRAAARRAVPGDRRSAPACRTTPANSTRWKSSAGQANQMAFSADGRRAVIASADRSVRYYEVEGRRDLKRFVGHTASVWAVALSAGRQAGPVRRHGRHGSTLGRRTRPAAAEARRPHRPGHGRRVRPGQPGGHRRARRVRRSCGTSTPAARSAAGAVR